MKNLIIAATLLLASFTSNVMASPILNETFGPNSEILINVPEVAPIESMELACFGCISKETGRPRTNYVRPHTRSNGTRVQGYWRS